VEWGQRVEWSSGELVKGASGEMVKVGGGRGSEWSSGRVGESVNESSGQMVQLGSGQGVEWSLVDDSTTRQLDNLTSPPGVSVGTRG
jgi:hypothetical protein